MNQIWFGLIWITPKESKTKEKNKEAKQTKTKKPKEKQTCFPD